ncbi:AraC family transcriptional regulator [Mucilaginibacter sp.]|uniref:AraC family transcriptional regulator n=1 Tax=Mucilaginibacter sp. TaxID=1882438 RepID=UPI0025F94177|nr:AraC family transcriptional regulator [Mucilaginibacter sp.]
MFKDQLREPFELVLKEYLDICPRGRHAHTFFELIYIVSGTGTQVINDLEMPYQKGNLFLVAPNDNHLFKISTTTQFFFIRFNNVFIQASKKDEDLLRQLELILQNSRNEPECILKSEADKHYVNVLMEMIIAEHLGSGLFHKELIRQLVNTLLVVIARNISKDFPEKIAEASEDKTLDILQYIQSNIYYPERLRADAIGTSLHISPHYLGRYFKKQTNETLQEYILSYKMKLIENRLLHSNMRMKEIADEFGFTDKSHMTRAFKKYRGINPSEFKKAG